MWPCQPNLGVQLTYGLYGAGIPKKLAISLYEPKSTPTNYLQFPRLDDQGPRFYKIENSSTDISKKIKHLSKDGESRTTWTLAGLANMYDDFYAPSTVVECAEVDAKARLEKVGYDPVKGPLSATFVLGAGGYSDAIIINRKPYYPRLKSNVIPVHCHAFARDQSTLRIVPMLPKSRNYLHTTAPKKSQKRVFAVPHLAKYAVECKFNFEILQVCAVEQHKLVVVRGLRHIAFVHVSWKNLKGEKGLMVQKAFSMAWDHEDLADIVVCDKTFTLVGCKETFSRYSYLGGVKWQYAEMFTGHLPNPDPSDLSAWRKVCGLPGSDYIFIFMRKAIVRVNIRTGAMQKVVTFHVWSRAQDVALIGNYVFLLTSQELVWVKISQSGEFKRILAWKHYLDSKDVTLKFSACRLQASDAYAFLVYSEEYPTSLMLTFGIRDGRPVVLRDPYMVPMDTKQHRSVLVAESAFEDENDSFLTVLATDLALNLTLMTLCQEENRAFRSESCKRPEADINPVPQAYSHRQLRVLYTQVETKICLMRKRMLEELMSQKEPAKAVASKEPSNLDSDKESSSDSEYDEDQAESGPKADSKKVTEPEDTEELALSEQHAIVQDYAFSLGDDVQLFFQKGEEDTFTKATVLTAHRSLAAIAEKIPSFLTDLDEFESMLAQLAKFYQTQDITLLPLDAKFLAKYNVPFDGTVTSIKDLPRFLSAFVGTEEEKIKAAVLLASSFTKAHNDYLPYYFGAIEEEKEGYPEELLEELSTWDVEPAKKHRGKKALQSAASRDAAGGKKKRSLGLLRRALTNSQHVTDLAFLESQEISSSDGDFDSLSQTYSQNGNGNIPLSPPRMESDGWSESELSQDSDFSQKSQKSQKSKRTQSQSQGQSQGLSQSQSIKRPGSQQLGKRKKKAKGGFA